MSGRRKFFLPFVLVAAFVAHLPPSGAQEKAPKTPKTRIKSISVEDLAEKVKPSVVVIMHTGRQGKQAGLGTGFVIDSAGLIATNFHVIGEGRPITVQLPDGSKHDVVSVHASDRHLDLAVIKIAGKIPTPLPLGDSDALRNGQAIAAIGHPQGLQHSVVAGVLSGRRDVEGISMLQVAMPIEQGNSGGPVLDMAGQVVGIVTMKSLVTHNLGFAVPVKDLHALLKKPNPVPMSRWVTLGRLDPADWESHYGGNWRQRAGRITVDGAGTGFGGRSLCFSQREVPLEIPYELAVSVKLDNERGAAGILFGGDGVDTHYGFYPSGGKLRLTRFDGPDVFSWKILHDAAHDAYRPGEWNTLKVRLEKDRVICFVNDREVVNQAGFDPFGHRTGLAKFRDTTAEFKSFRKARSIDAPIAPAEQVAKLKGEIESWKAVEDGPLAPNSPLLKLPADGMRLLRDRAAQLEKQALQLRKVAERVHQQRVLDELTRVVSKDDSDVDLLRASLLVARLDNEELDLESYVREVDRLAKEIVAGLPKDVDDDKKLDALNRALFRERGFHGSRHDYYSKNNSYINEVIDDREGLPITLSILYLEIARRLQLNVVGVALPGHFVVRHEPKDLPPYIIDVFEGGVTMTNQEAMEKIVKMTGKLPKRKDFLAASKKAIVSRVLHNLLNIAESEKDRDSMLRYLDALVAIDSNAHAERFARAVFRFQAGQRLEAIRDCDYLLDNADENEVDLDRVHELRRLLQRAN